MVSDFLASVGSGGRVNFSKLHAPFVIGYVQRRAKRLSGKRAQLMCSAIRSFLNFVRYRGDVSSDLAVHVPSVANWSLPHLPRSLQPEQVEQVLAHCCQMTSVGRRDHAILLLLARLGLRAAEVVGLTLDDIDWETGRITIHGKMNRVDHLPLPPDVGKAIAAYLKRDRPSQLKTRRLFLLVRAPLGGFKHSSSVSIIVKQALVRAGINSPQKGAHQFRHTLACELLRRGRLITEIDEILRHKIPATTAIYAKVDLLALRPLALPWPGGEQ